MARRAPRLLACGCISSGTPCRHQAAAKAAADQRRPTARQRGYDRAFQKAAAAFLREHPRCTCGAPAVLVRHRISIRRRPDLRMDPTNWLPGCRRCNARDVAREREEAGGVVQTSAKGTGTDRGPRRETPGTFSSRRGEQNCDR